MKTARLQLIRKAGFDVVDPSCLPLLPTLRDVPLVLAGSIQREIVAGMLQGKTVQHFWTLDTGDETLL